MFDNYQASLDCFDQVKFYTKKLVNTVVEDKYNIKFREKLSTITEDSKLFLYSKLKIKSGMENYLLQISNFKNRQSITKFRTSDHCLQIETGCYKNIPRPQRLCSNCICSNEGRGVHGD